VGGGRVHVEGTKENTWKDSHEQGGEMGSGLRNSAKLGFILLPARCEDGWLPCHWGGLGEEERVKPETSRNSKQGAMRSTEHNSPSRFVRRRNLKGQLVAGGRST